MEYTTEQIAIIEEMRGEADNTKEIGTEVYVAAVSLLEQLQENIVIKAAHPDLIPALNSLSVLLMQTFMELQVCKYDLQVEREKGATRH